MTRHSHPKAVLVPFAPPTPDGGLKQPPAAVPALFRQAFTADHPWFAVDALPWPVPSHSLSWLRNRGSLTLRLQQHVSPTLAVRVLSQRWGQPTTAEQNFLSPCDCTPAIIREVILSCHHSDMVYARTVFPRATVEGKNQQLASLNDRPLGSFLFAQKKVCRGPIELTRVTGDRGENVWARRSCFTVNGQKLAVYEFFLSGMQWQEEP